MGRPVGCCWAEEQPKWEDHVRQLLTTLGGAEVQASRFFSSIMR
jgi:hypothetical protein